MRNQTSHPVNRHPGGPIHKSSTRKKKRLWKAVWRRLHCIPDLGLPQIGLTGGLFCAVHFAVFLAILVAILITSSGKDVALDPLVFFDGFPSPFDRGNQNVALFEEIPVMVGDHVDDPSRHGVDDQIPKSDCGHVNAAVIVF